MGEVNRHTRVGGLAGSSQCTPRRSAQRQVGDACLYLALCGELRGRDEST